MIGAIGISTNQILLNSLATNTKKQTSSFNKLATGQKIVGLQSDATLNSTISSLDSIISSLSVVNQNIDRASGTLDVASGGLQQTLSNLQSLRELAVSGADDSLSAAARDGLSQSAASIQADITATAQSVTADGTLLLDGSFQDKTVQVGTNSGDTISISLAGARAGDLGVDDVDLSSSANSSNAITAIDAAIKQVTSELVRTGSTQARLESASTSNKSQSVNISSARSVLGDLDFAEATSELMVLQVRQSAGIAVFNTLIKTVANSSFQILA